MIEEIIFYIIVAFAIIMSVIIGIDLIHKAIKKRRPKRSQYITIKKDDYRRRNATPSPSEQELREDEGLISDCIKAFVENNSDKEIDFVFDTSCIKTDKADLEQLKKLRSSIEKTNFKFTMFHNTYYELLLLNKSSLHGNNAKFFISNICGEEASTEYDIYDITTLYTQPKYELSDLCSEKRITAFCFYDNIVFDEFLRYTTCNENDNIYVVNFGKDSIFKKLSEFKDYYSGSFDVPRKKSYVTPMPLNITSKPLLNATDLMESNESLVGASIDSTESFVFKNNSNNILRKIYKNKTVGENKKKKLELLLNKADLLPTDKLALPIKLVEDDDGFCIGFYMEERNGRPFIDDKPQGETEKAAHKEQFTNLALLLLELKLFGIYVPDMSYQNILLDATGTNSVCFIDCDSFQVDAFPSECSHHYSIHKELVPFAYDDNNVTKTTPSLCDFLREPHHFNFCFAVLLFQSLVTKFNKHPLEQPHHTETENNKLKWNELSFPYDKDDSLPLIERWDALSNQQKNLFASEFNFTRTYSLGKYIEIFGLY